MLSYTLLRFKHRLEYLTIEGSNITGTIPNGIGALTELKELFIQDTSMNGTIPTEIGLCTDLELFTITNTNISGTIPVQLTNNVPTLCKCFCCIEFHFDQTSNNPVRYIRCSPTLRIFVVVTALITLQENSGLEGSISDSVCPYIESGLLHVSISCDIECNCCADNCPIISANGGSL